MASKLDELMELADEYADAYHHDECGHFPEGASRPRRVTLQSALKAVVEDGERLDWLQTAADARKIELAKSLFGGGYEIGQWPSMRVTVKIGTLRDAIDAARKP